ncbi:putative (E)-beta-ocimene synthase, partial [Tanacetum coccineum]
DIPLINPVCVLLRMRLRGKTANSITCYMHDTGLSEEVARGYIKVLIDEAWRKLIKARADCSQESADPIIDMAINLARISTCTYQYGDGSWSS